MPTVSVIIPTHNRKALLSEAIASVRNQEYTDYELVIVDDGSSDGTWETLRACSDGCSNVRAVRQERQGVSAARNTGIRASCGPLIAFLDSDDLWLPGKLAAQVAFFDANPSALICQTDELWIRNGVRVNPGKRHQKTSGMIFERSVELCLVSPSAVMLRRDLLEEVGTFDESMPACEDYDLWLRVSCRFPVHLIDEPLVVKRGGHRDQLSRQPGLDRYRIYALAKILDSPPPEGLTASQRRAAVRTLQEKCAIYAAGCLKRNRNDEAREYLALKDRFAIDV